MKPHKFVLVALVLFGLSSFGSAYPIPPQPLRRLCMESQFIVVATVEGSASPNRAESVSEGKARLRISSVLKGSIDKRVIEVAYSPNMVCPAPPSYPRGSTVIAFLDRSRGEKFFTTHGLSYGSKVLSESELVIYVERISEILEILSHGDSPEKEKQTTEWLVRCAEEPATRWEGAYELSPGGSLMSFYEKEEPHDFAAMITEEQKSRLSSALFRSTTISSEDFCLINLLKDDEGERLVVFILRYLKNVVNDPPYYTDQLMAFISDKLGNKEALELTREFSDLDLLDDKEGKQRKRMLSDFIALIERRMTA
jgi:hypothetical protein